MKNWKILYRGSLSSCNYSCSYCPFSGKTNNAGDLLKDKSELERFINWAENQNNELELLFTPYGEALIHTYYTEGLIKLSNLPNVKKVVVQTNLSCNLKWVPHVNKQTFALWCSFHSSQVNSSEFLNKCNLLSKNNVNYSVGCVGIKEDFDSISRIRSLVNPNVYVWINAYKHEANYYSEADIQFLKSVDPLFDYNTKIYQTEGKACSTGDSVFSVMGNGDMQRCHFDSKILGNIYNPGFDLNLFPRLCEKKTCHCYIGYVHLEELGLANIYGNQILERIYVPANFK